MNSPPLRWSASPALTLLLAAALCGACRQGPSLIPEPSPESLPQDTPGAAERAALGTSTMGRPSPAPSDPAKAKAAQTAEEEAGLAVTTSINEAKKAADARAAAAADAGANAGDRVTLVFSAATAGQLVPCGCSPDQRGGLPRAAGLLKKWRTEEKGLVYVDAGDLLFPSAAPVTGALAAQAELKARTLAQGAALLGAAARVAGRRDLASGEAFLAETAGGVPLLDAGAKAAGTLPGLLVRGGAGGILIGLLAAGDGEARLSERDLAPRVELLRKGGAQLVVLLAHPRGDRALQAAAALQPAAKAAGVDLIVLGRRDDPSQDPDSVQAGSPPVLAPEGHGQTLLRIDLLLPPGKPKAGAPPPLFLSRGAAGKQAERDGIDQRLALLRERAQSALDPELKAALQAKVAELEQRQRAAESAVEQPPPGAVVATVRFVKLDKSVPGDDAAAALVAAYDETVAAQNLAAARQQPEQCPPPAAGEAAFIGVSAEVKKQHSCASCHPTQAAFWARTNHARAYQTLEAVKKQFSLDCISCHVAGWQQPGGVCRIDRTAFGGPGVPTPPASSRIGPGASDALPDRLGVGRQGVQCESCHGAASLHANGGDLSRLVQRTTCTRCHEAENSPHFDYDRYLPWVTGTGHGDPLPPGETPRSRGELAAGHRLGPNPTVHAGSGAKQ